MTIRPASPADLPRCQDIERAAGQAFRAIGMAAIADDEPFGIPVLGQYRAAGRAWVHDLDGGPAAYLLMDVVDGLFHIEQVSVHPRAARRGLGRALIDDLAERAAGQGITALTLTTFADVPWNAPYYSRIGFTVLDDAAIGPQLRETRRHETTLGLDRWPRVAMLRRPGRENRRTGPA